MLNKETSVPFIFVVVKHQGSTSRISVFYRVFSEATDKFNDISAL